MGWREFARRLVCAGVVMALAGCSWWPLGRRGSVVVRQAPHGPAPIVNKIDCAGPYPALVSTDAEKVRFTAIGLDKNMLPRAADPGAEAEGRRCLVFFDVTADTEEADYAMFVFRDIWSLRQRRAPDDPSPAEVGRGPVSSAMSGDRMVLYVEISRANLQGGVCRTWFEAPVFRPSPFGTSTR